jgi:hypothetical protein
MTTEREFDRIAKAWLELGPDEAPDRVVAAVLQSVETTPQALRRIGWPTWRSFSMNRLPTFAAVAAAVVVVIGGAILLTRPSQPAVGGPTAPPSLSSSLPPSLAPSAAPSPSVTSAVPTTLQSMWVGPHRTIAGFPANARYRFLLSDTSLGFPDDSLAHPVFKSDASASAPSELQLTTTDASVGCQPGDLGRYAWSLSASGSQLTLVTKADACPSRSAALAGDWFRVGCKNIASACLGDLGAAGTYSSQYFTPMLGLADQWSPSWGAVTYTVPAGWANSSDWPNSFSLTPSADYASETADGPPTGAFHEIDLFRAPAATTQNAQCSKALIPTVPKTVDGLIGYVRGLKSIVSTAPVAITVDGHPGKWINIKLAATWKATCPGATGPTANILAFAGSDNNDYELGLSGNEQQRLVFVDLGSGNVMLILVDSVDPARFNQLVADAMPIIGSLHLK